jgi:hypothetical protein
MIKDAGVKPEGVWKEVSQSGELGLLPPPLAAELGFTRVRPLY